MSVKLTKGALLTIMNGGQIDQPVMQILGSKKVSNGINDRYRILISDGVHVNSFAMLATQLNDAIESGELQDNAVIRIDRSIVSPVNNSNTGKSSNKNILIILDLTVLIKGSDIGGKIGDPIPLVDTSGSANVTEQPAHVQEVISPAKRAGSDVSPLASPVKRVGSVVSPSASPVKRLGSNVSPLTSPVKRPMDATKVTHPIMALTPFQTRWVIKARVVAKTNIRTWSNPKSDGKLFSMDLVDESASIRATAFNEQCDKFYEIIELEKIYYISKCTLKPANKKFTTLKHDFEMTLTNDTQIIHCYENDTSIPHLQFDFVQFDILKDQPLETSVDVIGICQSTSSIQDLVSRTTGKDLKKRDVTLVDKTLASINLTLWGQQAEEFDGSLQPVVAVKCARMVEFMGTKSISLGISSVLQINPDIPEAHRLRGWYDSLPTNVQFSNISSKSDGISGKTMTLKEARLNNIGTGDKADYFNTECMVLFIQSSKALYQACPSADCQKKVIDQNNGQYRCEKCNMEYSNYKYRLMLQMQICDWTGVQWITIFQENAEILLGATAEEIGARKEAGDDCDDYFRRPLYKNFMFRLRAKMETFNNETRLKMTAFSVKPINSLESCKNMIAEIQQLTGVSLGATGF